MRSYIDVADREEAYWIRRALHSPAMRAFVVLAGKLLNVRAPYIPRVLSDLSEELRRRLEQERVSEDRSAAGEPAIAGPAASSDTTSEDA